MILFIWITLYGALTTLRFTIGSEESDTLFQDYFQWKLRTHPTWASTRGFHDYDSEIEDLSMKGIEKRAEDIQGFYDRSQELLSSGEEDTLTTRYLRLLSHELGSFLEGYKWNHYVFPAVNFLDGIFKDIPFIFSKNGPLNWKTDEDIEKNLLKLSKIPKYTKEIQELLSKGQTLGLTYSKEAFARVDFEKLKEDDILGEFEKVANESIKTKATSLVKNDVFPALKGLHEYIQNDYSLRESPGIHSLPNGTQRYEDMLRWHTTLKNITAEEVHTTGLKEVAKLREAFKRDIAIATGVKNPKYAMNFTVEAIFRRATKHPKMKFHSSSEILRFNKDIIYKKINPRLKNLFHTDLLDKIPPVNVVADGTTGLSYYRSAPSDGSRNGSFTVGTEEIEDVLRFTAMSLSLHEANPGHHLQLSHIQLSGFPRFISELFEINRAVVPGELGISSAFIEGWALYSEYLGHEMKLFEENPIQLIGYYSYNLLRAARLVVDTGIHALGWSREKAIKYLDENTGETHSANTFSIDRYIIWPGQATSYKIGELKIQELRKKAEEFFGEDFSIKDFHGAILECFGPLYLLEECVDLELGI